MTSVTDIDSAIIDSRAALAVSAKSAAAEASVGAASFETGE